MISEILLECAEDLYGWYRSESLIRFDEAVTAEDDTAKAQLEQVYARLNDCMTYESQFCGCAFQTLPQYLAAQMPNEDVDCFFRRLLEKEIIQTPDHPAAAEEADDITQRMCLEQLADHFIRWDALDLLNRVLADDEKAPEYSAITASKLLELGRRFQILFYGRNIPDLASFLSQYGYDDSSVRRLYARCADEDRRYRDVRPAQSLPEQIFFGKTVIDIDYIMELLDWHRSASDQAKGIALAENVQNFNVFLQPCQKNFNINVWENCAKIISKRTDEELTPYLTRLMEWLQDLNWPGATTIVDRLNQYKDEQSFRFCYNECLTRAERLDDEMWAEWLQLIKRESV